MKKLICENDIERLVSEGKKTCYVTEETLVTSSAKDAATVAGIEIVVGEEPVAPADAAYCSEQDPTGLKVVRGNTVRMDEFFEGNPRVKYQELIDKNSSHISSGLLVIDHDTYEWTQNYDENDYVIEGTFCVTINGTRYTVNAGDCIFIPNGASVVMGSKDHCCRVFYNTYPSNWADLL